MNSESGAGLVALFAGQGAQAIGMGKDLYEADVAGVRGMFDRADEVLGFPLTRVMFEGPLEELTRTSRCQPALYVHGLACLRALREQSPDLVIGAAAGLSLGEFTAHACAGTFDYETGLDLVFKRGTFMEEQTDAVEGSMAAMMGGTEEQVRALAEAAGVDVANLNAPGQVVLSGSKEGIARAVAEARDHGIKLAKELTVAGAYHSRLMQPAQDKLAAELAKTGMRAPEIPVICNVDARAVSAVEEIKDTLERQVTGSVRWSESMRLLVDDGHDRFVELGPGKVLAGLMRRIEKGVEVVQAADLEGIGAVLG